MSPKHRKWLLEVFGPLCALVLFLLLRLPSMNTYAWTIAIATGIAFHIKAHTLLFLLTQAIPMALVWYHARKAFKLFLEKYIGEE